VTPNMRITARAQAAHDASIGDTIRVINTRSKKTIEGIVSAPDRVVVSSASSILN